MKKITIPKRFGYPTVDITINGKEETFQSGVEISVDDSIAEAIENAIGLEPKTKPIGYSKIATYTVKKGANGALPNRVTINKGDDGKPFRIKDFFLKMKLAHTIEGATTAKLLVRGMVDDVADTRCSSGHCQLSNLSKDSLTQYYARFVTCRKGGGGILMVAKTPFYTDYLYGTTPHFSGEGAYISPTEPDVPLEDGMNTILAIMLDADSKEIPFAEGCTFELWGERI